jgi:hypothetical protein
MKNETFTGVAYIAAMHRKFPLQALDVFIGVKRPAMAVLWGLFGRNRKPMKEFMKRSADRPHMLEIYLLNRWGDSIGPADRNKMSDLLEARDPRIIKQIRRRITSVTRFIQKHKNDNTHPVLGYDLESKLSKKAVKVIAEEVDRIWPYDTCHIPADTHETRHGTLRRADYMEFHNRRFNYAENQIGSLDGQEIRFEHRNGGYGDDSISEDEAHYWMISNYGKAAALFYWSKRHQGLEGNTSTSKPPKKREIIVPIEDIKWMRRSIRQAQQT